MAAHGGYYDSPEEVWEEMSNEFSEDDESDENPSSDCGYMSDRGSEGEEVTDYDDENPYRPPPPSPPLKLRKKENHHSKQSPAGSDLISALPDPLLLHILSFLPMKNVVGTGILSKKWRYLWTNVENLSFSFRNSEDEKLVQKFITFVDKTLVLCTHSNIRKFAFDFDYHRCFVSNLNLWVRFAMQKNFKELDLNLYSPRPGHRYKLPQYVYENSALVKLSLSKCKIMPYRVVDWRSLRVLTIKCAEVTAGVVHTIFKGSPVLEFLELYRCWVIGRRRVKDVWSDRLSIHSSSLKKLVIRGYRCPYFGGDEDVFEIFAPNVLSLEIKGYLNNKEIRLVKVSSLVDAKLEFYQDDNFKAKTKMLKNLLRSLRHVKNLTLGSWCTQVLSTLEAKCLPSPLSERKSLRLVMTMKKWELPGIASLLQSSPDLETLVINKDPLHYSEFCFGAKFLKSYDFDVESYWTSKKAVFEGLLLHLNTVKVVGFTGDELELAFLQFVLENAGVLEKMVINAERAVCEEYAASDTSPKFLKVSQRLLSFPRSSSNVAIMFPKLLK